MNGSCHESLVEKFELKWFTFQSFFKNFYTIIILFILSIQFFFSLKIINI